MIRSNNGRKPRIDAIRDKENTMTNVVIAGAVRTPIGTLGGSLSAMTAAQLGAVAIREALKRAEVAADDVDEVVLGQVLTARHYPQQVVQAAAFCPAKQAYCEVQKASRQIHW